MQYRLFLNGIEYVSPITKSYVDGEAEALIEAASTLDKHTHPTGAWAIVRLSDRFIHAVVKNGNISETAAA